MTTPPEVGAPLSTDDFNMILGTLAERIEKHPEEPSALALYLVLGGIGERFRMLECTEQEYTCLRIDFPEGEGDPKCPNGHDMFPAAGMTIGWVAVE